MDKNIALQKAQSLFAKINSEYVDQLGQQETEVGYVFSEPARGGRSIIIGNDGGLLFFASSVNSEEAIQAYRDGKRTPEENFTTPQ